MAEPESNERLNPLVYADRAWYSGGVVSEEKGLRIDQSAYRQDLGAAHGAARQVFALHQDWAARRIASVLRREGYSPLEVAHLVEEEMARTGGWGLPGDPTFGDA